MIFLISIVTFYVLLSAGAIFFLINELRISWELNKLRGELIEVQTEIIRRYKLKEVKK